MEKYRKKCGFFKKKGAVLIALLLCILNLFPVYPVTVQAAQSNDTPIDFVLILDCSGSMAKSDEENLSVSAAKMFVDMLPAENARLAVIAMGPNYGSEAYPMDGLLSEEQKGGLGEKNVKEAFSLQSITDQDAKQEAKDVIDRVTEEGAAADKNSNYTPIGYALKAAGDVLTKNGTAPDSASIILLSDGRVSGEADGSRYNDALDYTTIDEQEQQAAANGWPIYCLELNYDHANVENGGWEGKVGWYQMPKIAQQTDGERITLNSPTEAQNAFANIFAKFFEATPTTASGTIQNGVVSLDFNIEEMVAETNITLTGNINEVTEITIRNSDGKEYTYQKSTVDDNRIITYDNRENKKYITAKLLTPKEGAWSITAKGTDGVEIGLYAVSIREMNLQLNAQTDQTSVANSISALKDLNSWEAAYENAAARDTVHSCNSEFVTPYTELSGRETDKARGPQMIPDSTDGEHDLLASTGLSWEHYPSVNIKMYGDDFQKKVLPEFGKMTTESKYRTEVFNKKIEYALQEKIIECVCNGNQYTYFLNTIPADWTDLSVEMYMADENSLEKGKFKRGEPLFKYLAAQNPHAFSSSRKRIRLAGSEFFDTPFDFSGILEKEHWTPEMVTQKHRSYMKRIMRKNISLYRELEETLYRYEGIRSTLAAGELQYREAYQINLFLELFRVGQLCTDAKEKVWNVRVNEQGITQKIVEFSATKLEMLKGMEKGLWKDKLRLVLVYRAFGKLIEQGKLSLEELDETREKILGAMDEDEFDQIKTEKLRYLQSCYMTFAKKYGNKDADKREKEMADAWGLKGTERESVHEVVKVYRKIREMLEEEGIDLEAETVPMPEQELTSETGWICPKCGAKHADTVLFCPNDATPKPVSADPDSWICPKCGTKHANTVLFCPNDGTQQPVSEPEGWICPKCGTKHASTVLFCPNDGTQQPVSEPEGWICPKCGTKHANTVLFCPNDGTPRSGAKPEGWICPACGTKHADTVLFCPNDGTRKPQ